MSKALTARVAGVALLALTVAGVVGSGRADTSPYGELSLYTEVLHIIRDRYVDEVPWSKLVHGGIRGMVGGLDAHSEVLGPEQYRELTREAGRVDGGIGVELTRRHNTVTVITAIDGTPAQKAGVEPGDQILEIDGSSTAEMVPIDAAIRLRGGPGTQVVLKVARNGWAEPKSLTLTRAVTPVDRVTARELGHDVICVRIGELENTTSWKLDRVLSRVTATPRGLILDLRNSPGTGIRAAAEIAGMFVDSGRVVARIQGRLQGQPRELRARAEDEHLGVPMAVLVNRGTAAASEILAGALQDWGRAVIVGTTTSGEASAQSRIPLSDGSVLSLTTARYLTPKGHRIDGKGISPDLVVDMPKTAALRAGETRADPQLDLALDVVTAASIMELRSASGAHRDQAGSRVQEARTGLLHEPIAPDGAAPSVVGGRDEIAPIGMRRG